MEYWVDMIAGYPRFVLTDFLFWKARLSAFFHFEKYKWNFSSFWKVEIGYFFHFLRCRSSFFFEKEKIEFFFFFGKVHMKLHKYIFLLRPVTLFYLAGAVLWIGFITDFWKWSAKDWNFLFVSLVVGVYL